MKRRKQEIYTIHNEDLSYILTLSCSCSSFCSENWTAKSVKNAQLNYHKKTH